MHFRTRHNIVQIIRVTYDPLTKRGKNTIVGRLNKSSPTITDDLKNACNEVELNEIRQWIQNAERKHTVQSEHAALTAAEQLQAAAAWLGTQKDKAHAQKVYDQIRGAWLKVRQHAAAAGLATQPSAAKPATTKQVAKSK